MKGRGVERNPPNRFERFHFESAAGDASPGPSTEFFVDGPRAIISRNDSPDVDFDFSVNPYRGCEHGCAYCFARPTHEYLGFSSGLDFETRILVKPDAAKRLEAELGRRSWRPAPLAMSGVTDPYQPVERRLGLTRACVEVLARVRNPLIVITKNDLVVRDADLLAPMAAWNGVAVYLSVTSLDEELVRKMEPRATAPGRRLDAIGRLSDRGIPVGVLAAPIVPGLTDHEIPRILHAAREAGAVHAGYIPLRLPFAVAGLFEDWLETHFPERRSKVMNRIRAIRDGRTNDPRFGSRMRGHGPFAEEMAQLFRIARQKAGFRPSGPRLNVTEFRLSAGAQRTLFS